MKRILCLTLVVCNGLIVMGQPGARNKADIVFMLRGYENSCLFCDSASFDIHAKIITKQLKELSFGKISSYDILFMGNDERSPIYLQSLRDIDVLQASLDGWPGTKWDWLRDRTDFWYVVPDEYRLIIQDAINWMKSNKDNLDNWGKLTEAGITNYRTIQTNVQRMGSSAAADYLLDMKMPANYDPQNYGTTIVILNSQSSNSSGSGASNTMASFGVLNSKGEPYPTKNDGNEKRLAYVVHKNSTDQIYQQTLYTTSVHEAIHNYGMGTHDQDPNNDLAKEYSVMFRSSLNSINTLPAWNRYYWTHWLPKSTITKDSSLVNDLYGRMSPADTTEKFILEVIAGDDLGRGGTYRELYQGKWYTYQIDAGGTLTFKSAIDNEHRSPGNYIAVIPETLKEGQKSTFSIYNDGEQNYSYSWKKDGQVIQNGSSNSFVIKQVSYENAGKYEVTISNPHGTLTTAPVNVKVVCGLAPNAPVVSNVTYCIDEPSSLLTATVSPGNQIAWYASNQTGGASSNTAPTPITSKAGTSDYYVSQKSNENCESSRSRITVEVTPIPNAPVVSNVTYCMDEPSSFLTASVSSGNQIAWYGSNQTGGTSSSIAPTPITSKAGTSDYYVSQKSTENCESSRSRITVVINAKPAAPTLSLDNQLNLVSTATQNKWYFNGTLLNETAQKIKLTSFGIYTAVAQENGCLSQSSESFNYIVTATMEYDKKSFTAYPNPFQDAFQIDFNSKEVDLEIYNITGSKVFSKKGLKSGEAINSLDFSAGEFLLLLLEKGKPVHVLKILKY
jgi:hypothetical protein